MNRDTLSAWVRKLGRAWEERNPQAAAALFSADVVYSDNPFEPALRGRTAVFEYWQSETEQHDQVRFDFSIIGITGDTGIAHWQATFTRVGTQHSVVLDGVIVVQFNQAGECTNLREWWHRAEVLPTGELRSEADLHVATS